MPSTQPQGHTFSNSLLSEFPTVILASSHKSSFSDSSLNAEIGSDVICSQHASFFDNQNHTWAYHAPLLSERYFAARMRKKLYATSQQFRLFSSREQPVIYRGNVNIISAFHTISRLPQRFYNSIEVKQPLCFLDFVSAFSSPILWASQ